MCTGTLVQHAQTVRLSWKHERVVRPWLGARRAAERRSRLKPRWRIPARASRSPARCPWWSPSRPIASSSRAM